MQTLVNKSIGCSFNFISSKESIMRRGSYFPPLVYKYGQLAINIVYFDYRVNGNSGQITRGLGITGQLELELD